MTASLKSPRSMFESKWLAQSRGFFGSVIRGFTVHTAQRTVDLTESTADAPDARLPLDIFGPRPTKPKHLKDLTRWKKDENGYPIWLRDRS